jgi:hypothetical protein
MGAGQGVRVWSANCGDAAGAGNRITIEP